MKTQHHGIYPTISQSWGIVGIIILSMIIFSPLQYFSQGVLGTELSFLIYYLFSMGGAFLFIHLKRRKISTLTSYNFTGSSSIVIVLLIITTITIQVGISFPILNLLPMPEFIKEILLELGERKGIFSFIAIVITAPFIEELIFRGIILDGLLRNYSPVKSIIISSFMFGLVHLNPWQFMSAFILGLLSGWVYYQTGKLTLAIIVHLVNNFIAFIGIFLSEPASYEKSLTELYGSLTSLVLITLTALIILGLASYLLRKRFSKSNIVSWQFVENQAVDETEYISNLNN